MSNEAELNSGAFREVTLHNRIQSGECVRSCRKQDFAFGIERDGAPLPATGGVRGGCKFQLLTTPSLRPSRQGGESCACLKSPYRRFAFGKQSGYRAGGW